MIKRAIGFVVIFFILITLHCCNYTKVKDMDDADRIVLKKLEKKYDKEFVILDMKKEDIGQNFAQYICKGNASEADNEEETFQYYLTADEAELKDNYQKLIYGEKVNKEVEEILISDYFEIREIEIEYYESDVVCKNYKEFKTSGDMRVEFDMYVDSYDYKKGVEEAYKLLQKMYDNDLYFDVDLIIGDKNTCVNYDYNSDMPAEEEIYQWLIA